MKKPVKSFSSTPKSPVSLLRWTGSILIVIFLVAGCSSQPPLATQSAPTAVESAAPAVTEQQPAPTETPPSPSVTVTSVPPTETPAPTETPLSLPTLEATTEPTVSPAETGLPVEATPTTYVPVGNGVTFQIKNQTNRTILVYGYEMSKTIPSGLTVYYQAPAWGEISLRVCHKNKDDSAGGCYIYYGTISESKPVIVITKS